MPHHKDNTMRRQFLLVLFLIIKISYIFGEELEKEDTTPEPAVDNANNADQVEVVDETTIPEVYGTYETPEATANIQETETPETERPVIDENKHKDPAYQPSTAYNPPPLQPQQNSSNIKGNNQIYTTSKTESLNYQSSSAFCKICKTSEGCGHTEHIQSSVANQEKASATSSFTEVKKSPDGYEEHSATSSIKQEQSSSVNNEYFKHTSDSKQNPNKKKHVQNENEPITVRNAKDEPNGKEYLTDKANEQPRTDKTQRSSHSETKNGKNESKREVIQHKISDNQNREWSVNQAQNGNNDENAENDDNIPAAPSNNSTGCQNNNNNSEKPEKTRGNINNKKNMRAEPYIRKSDNKNTNKSGPAANIEKDLSGRNENHKAQNPSKEHKSVPSVKKSEDTSGYNRRKYEAKNDYSPSNARKELKTKTSEHATENKEEKSQHTKEQNDDKRKEIETFTTTNVNNNGTKNNKYVNLPNPQDNIKDESHNTNKNKVEGDKPDKISSSPKKQENEKKITNTETSVDKEIPIEERLKVTSDNSNTEIAEQNKDDPETNKQQKINTDPPTQKTETNTETPVNNVDSSNTPLQHQHHTHNPIIEVVQNTNENDKEILDILFIFPDDDYYNESTENGTVTPIDESKQVKEKLKEPITQNATDQSKPKSENCNCKETKPTKTSKTEETENPEQHNEPNCHCDKDRKENNNNTPQQEINDKQFVNTQTQTEATYNEDTIQTNREIREQSNYEANTNYNTEQNTYNTKYNTYNTESTTRIDNRRTETYNEQNIRNSNVNTEQNTNVKTDKNIQSSDTDSVRITNNNSTNDNDTIKSEVTNPSNTTTENSIPNKNSTEKDTQNANNDNKEPKTKDKKDNPNQIYRSNPDKSNHRKGRHDTTPIQGKQKIHHAIQNNINIKTFVLDDEDGLGQCFCCCNINKEDVFVKYDE